MSSPLEANDIYDPDFVRDVFDKCSDKYIAFSTVCSLGFTEIWRRQCVHALGQLPVGAVGYDLMAGTGEVWPHLLNRHSDIASIIAVDISSGMHARALTRLHALREHKIGFIKDDVLDSQLEPASADFVISTFGLKTFNPDQHRRLAQVTRRVLKPGGRFAFIEASDPNGWFLRPLYLFHLRKVLPLVERTWLKGAQDFSMIGTYSMNFGNAARFADMLRAEGLKTQYHRYFFGCATGVSGSRTSDAISG